MPTLTLPTLAHHRALAGFSQRGLAQRVGVNYQTIRRIELGGDAGELPTRVLVSIAKALKVTVDALLSPASVAVVDEPEPASRLNLQQARVLFKIATSPHPGAGLTKTERELVLPTLIRRGEVVGVGGRPELSNAARQSLHSSALEEPTTAAR